MMFVMKSGAWKASKTKPFSKFSSTVPLTIMTEVPLDLHVLMLNSSKL